MACPQIDLQSVDCRGCPAQRLKAGRGYGSSQNMSWRGWVEYCESLRRAECEAIVETRGGVKLYILAESIPRTRFVYDRRSNYHERHARKGLRTWLCKELLGVSCPPDIGHCSQCPHLDRLLELLRCKGILIVDCALCPLHRLDKKDRRRAATLCLQNNTKRYLDIAPNAPIITVFPAGCGFLRRQLPNVQRRVVREFAFENLSGLKSTIEQILGDL